MKKNIGSLSLLVLISIGLDAATIPTQQNPLIGSISIEDTLKRMARGDRIVFVDVREQREYREGHIPGAVNLQLRNVRGAKDMLAELKQSDLVIPYCLKDFRGFEVARALSEAGLDNVALITEHGLNAWKSRNLPIEFE